MRPSRSRRRTRRERGFALIAALALLVVLGSTGAIMVRLASVQQSGATLAILGARADQAARSGIEWALHRSVALDDCPAPVATLSLSEGALAGFRVVVRCTASRHEEGSDSRLSVALRAEASRGALGDRDFVYREMEATAVF